MKTSIQADIHRGFLLLVNAAHPARTANEDRHLVPVADARYGVRLHNTAAALLQSAMKHLGCEAEITATSGYRSKEEQARIFAESLRANGRAFTEQYVAKPGHSEHQTGLAVDMALAGPDIDTLTPHFPYDGICQTFREAVTRYGFIERYPQGKEHITGIGHEPWHFRYVGVPHAAIMYNNGLVLEEYIDLLRGYPFGSRRLRFSGGGQSYEIGFVPAEDDIPQIAAPGGPVLLSGNNADGFILTKWC